MTLQATLIPLITAVWEGFFFAGERCTHTSDPQVRTPHDTRPIAAPAHAPATVSESGRAHGRAHGRGHGPVADAVGRDRHRGHARRHRERDLGERAALHALRHGVKLAPDERAILLTEDDRVLRGSFIVAPEDRERMILMTTRDFLVALEAAGRINSADEVYRNVEDAGRTASRREILKDQHQTAIAAVERVIRRRPSDPEPNT